MFLKGRRFGESRLRAVFFCEGLQGFHGLQDVSGFARAEEHYSQGEGTRWMREEPDQEQGRVAGVRNIYGYEFEIVIPHCMKYRLFIGELPDFTFQLIDGRLSILAAPVDLEENQRLPAQSHIFMEYLLAEGALGRIVHVEQKRSGHASTQEFSIFIKINLFGFQYFLNFPQRAAQPLAYVVHERLHGRVFEELPHGGALECEEIALCIPNG